VPGRTLVFEPDPPLSPSLFALPASLLLLLRCVLGQLEIQQFLGFVHSTPKLRTHFHQLATAQIAIAFSKVTQEI
jgi:hypothetical protein